MLVNKVCHRRDGRRGGLVLGFICRGRRNCWHSRPRTELGGDLQEFAFVQLVHDLALCC